MQFLSGLSLAGLLLFIGFSSVGRADVFQPDVEVVERHNDYERNTDPRVIINNEYNTSIYAEEVEIEFNSDYSRNDRRNDRRYDNVNRRRDRSRWNQGPATLPYPQPNYNRPVCRIYRLHTHPNLFDVWIGNVIYRRGSYQFVNQVYWNLVNSGQCLRG